MRPPRSAGAGLVNLRDVGGLPVEGGRRVVTGALYRSDAPLPGDPDPVVRPWPPRTVVDLRSPGESATSVHPLASSHTDVVELPLSARLDPRRIAMENGVDVADLPMIYRVLVRDMAARLVEVVDVVASAPAPVLVHCAAGKDRTGIAVGVTLAAVGVLPEAIVADYERTREGLDALLERMSRGWSRERREQWLRHYAVERPELMLAPRAAIEAVVRALDEWPGGASSWVVDHGLEPSRLDALRQRLTEPA